MKIGDIVAYWDKRWLVTTASEGHMYVLRTWSGEETEVPRLYDEQAASGLKIVARAGSWPFIAAPIRTKNGAITRVALLREGRQWELTPLVHWAPSGMQRPGGPLFFSPDLHLQCGEVLIATYKSGKSARLLVNTSFANVQTRKRKAELAQQPPARRTIYDRLMDDEDMFGDSEDT